MALVALSITPTALGAAARAEDAPGSWTAGELRFEPLAAEGSRIDVAGLGAFAGTITVRAGGGLSVFNELALEDYVKGVVEMPAAWPSAALEAQAIAARTYGLHTQLVRGEICPDDGCQFYMGLLGTEREGGERWAAAVDATAGRALLAGGEPIRAEFSGSNGGRSVPGGTPYLRAVDDPDDASSPAHRWHYTLALADLAPFVDVPEGSTLVRISRDGGAVVVAVKPEKGDPVEHDVNADAFARAVNASLGAPEGLPMPFPSMRFTIATDGDRAVVDGGGWGHGRGMSQWGAYGKAQRGLSASSIVAAYYGGLHPSELSAEQAATTVRVALAQGRGSVVVTPGRPSRLVAGDGTVLVPLTFGPWRVVAGREGARAIAPDHTGEALAISGAGVTGGRRLVGAPPAVRFTLSGPAVVTVRLRGPGLDTTPPPMVVLDGGEQVVGLPAPRAAGPHVVTVRADGGPGRQAATELSFDVRGRAVLEASAPAAGRTQPLWATLAGVLAVAILAATVAVAGRRRPA